MSKKVKSVKCIKSHTGDTYRAARVKTSPHLYDVEGACGANLHLVSPSANTAPWLIHLWFFFFSPTAHISVSEQVCCQSLCGPKISMKTQPGIGLQSSNITFRAITVRRTICCRERVAVCVDARHTVWHRLSSVWHSAWLRNISLRSTCTYTRQCMFIFLIFRLMQSTYNTAKYHMTKRYNLLIR